MLEEDISLPQNPVIAKFFRIVKLAENAGYGFDKMIEGWKEYTGSAPRFDQGQDFTKATFYFKKKAEDVEKLGNKLGKREQLIFNAISDNPHITIAELAKKLKVATTTVEYNINKLKKKQLLQRIGSRKEGQWKVSS